MASDPLLEALETIYDAGTDPARWPDALAAVQALRALFAKTDTGRQSELVRQLARLTVVAG